MAQEINVLVVEAGKAPRPERVLNTMEAFAEIVGGPVEAGVYLPQRVMLIRNSEGKNLGLPPNRADPRTKDYIAGTFLLCGFEGTSFTSLTQTQQNDFLEYLRDRGRWKGGFSALCPSKRSHQRYERESEQLTGDGIARSAVVQSQLPVSQGKRGVLWNRLGQFVTCRHHSSVSRRLPGWACIFPCRG